VQLATFSGVEQQVRTNQLLESLAAGIGMSGISQLAGWVGMEARVAAPATFDGTPITLAPAPDAASDAATLVVRDQFDRVVSREPVPLGAGTMEWVGVGSDGAPLPSGTYTFQLESLNAGEITSITTVEHYAMVEEARQGAAGIEIVLRDGTGVLAANVAALRRPGNAS
jgi:flagellar basal-body rod modification protein FlgD